MTGKIVSRFKQRIAAFELEPSSGGCFELTADGTLLYSKLKTGSFPDEASLVSEIEQRL